MKSKQRREKKAKKTRVIAMKALSGGKKRGVFDENARQEYLTGFGKRKQERRKYGLAMEVCNR